MTEQEWLENDFVEKMITYLYKKPISPRKIRLYICALCRWSWKELIDKRSQDAVIAAEDFTDGFITFNELRRMHIKADDVHKDAWESQERVFLRRTAGPKLTKNQIRFAWIASEASRIDLTSISCVGGTPYSCFPSKEPLIPNQIRASFIREIWGNPFKALSFDEYWRTPTVLDLAKSIYEQREFEVFPILGDALEDARCDNEDILNHCRNLEQSHCKGCWVLDLILQKS